jgi:peptidoglycan/LPS O-acetylase OafA/YrhL
VTARVPETTPDERARDPRLDGVRGIAILLVLVCHLTQYGGMRPDGPFLDRVWRAWTMPLGFGVDLFFVLSGFLITGILLDTREGPDYFRNFYARRVLRIFPLYYASLAVAFLLIPSVRRDAVWYWTYLTNFRFAEVGWPKVPYLGHFWSLAVEEQFYLVWPALVFFLPRRALPWLCLGAVAYGIAGRYALLQAGAPLYANLATQLHLDGLAIGCLLACLARRPKGLAPWRPLAVVVAAGATVATIVLHWRGYEAPTVGKRVLLQTIVSLGFGGCLLLAATASPSSRLRAALCAPWLTRVGLYSYSLYVIHAPILVWAGRHEVNVRLLPSVLGSQLPAQLLFSALTAALCLALSALSYHQLELRFLALKRYFRYRRPTPPPTPPPRVEQARAPAV